MLYRVVQPICLHWSTLWEGECISFFLNYWLFVCACLCPIGEWNIGYLSYVVCTLLWWGATWWGTCLTRSECMRTCFFIRGEYVTHMKIQGFHVVLAILAIQIIVTYIILVLVYCEYGIPQEAACIGYLTWSSRNQFSL